MHCKTLIFSSFSHIKCCFIFLSDYLWPFFGPTWPLTDQLLARIGPLYIVPPLVHMAMTYIQIWLGFDIGPYKKFTNCPSSDASIYFKKLIILLLSTHICPFFRPFFGYFGRPASALTEPLVALKRPKYVLLQPGMVQKRPGVVQKRPNQVRASSKKRPDGPLKATQGSLWATQGSLWAMQGQRKASL